MLEDEGVVFEDDNGVDKIREEYFIGEVDGAAGAMSGSGSKRKRTDGNNDSRKIKSKKEASLTTPLQVSEAELKREILSILQKRAVGKTC